MRNCQTPVSILPADIPALRAALSAAGEKPRFVMVGASAGGIYVRFYQLDQPP